MNIVKKLVLAFASLGIITIGSISYGSTSYGAEHITIMVKNKPIQTDTAPIVEQGRVLIPLRAVSEALGATVAWDQKMNTATISKWSEKLKLTVGQKKAFLEGRLDSSGILLDVSVKVVKNRVYVPLRFLSEVYGYKVNWSNNTVSIHSPLDNEQRKTLYNGDLATARKFAMASYWNSQKTHYEHTPLNTLHEHEVYDTIFMFPEGEALRFFVIDSGETISLMEYKEDFLIVTWQAHLKTIGEDGIQSLFEDKLKDKTGPTPSIKKAFLYQGSGIFGDSGWKSNGIIDLDGKVTETGYERYVGSEVMNSTGSFSLTLPGEVRNEVVDIFDSTIYYASEGIENVKATDKQVVWKTGDVELIAEISKAEGEQAHEAKTVISSIKIESSSGNYTINLDKKPLGIHSASLSKNRQLAVHVRDHEGSRLIILDLLSGDQVVLNKFNLTDQAMAREKADSYNWSPDGKKLAFGIGDIGSSYIALYDTESKAFSELSSKNYRIITSVAWHKDGLGFDFLSKSDDLLNPSILYRYSDENHSIKKIGNLSENEQSLFAKFLPTEIE